MKPADPPASRTPTRSGAADAASPSPDRHMPVGLAAPVRLIWDSHIPILLQDERFRIVDANLAYLRFTGHAHERLIGLDPLELAPPQDRKAVLAWRAAVSRDPARAEASTSHPERLIDRTGHERWFRASRNLLTDAQGRRYWMSVLQDCTVEHQERVRADRADAEIAHWLDLSPLGMALFDATGRLVRSNRVFETLVGPVPAKLSDAPPALQQLMAWGPQGPAAQLQPGAPELGRQAWMNGEGQAPRRVRSSVRCHESPDGLRHYLAVVEDLSLEEERDLALSQRDALMDAAGVGMSTFQQASGWLRPPSSGGAAAAPSQPSPAVQSINRDLVLPETMAEYERLQQALRESRRAEVRYAIVHPEFGRRWLLTRVEPAKLASGIQSTSVITLDVTDQHLAEQRNEQLLRDMGTIMENAPAGIAYLRGDVLVRCNRRFEQMMDLAGGAPAGATLAELLGRHPSPAHAAQQIGTALAGGGRYEAEFQACAPADAEPGSAAEPAPWLSLSVRRIEPASASMDAIVVMSDVSRLKREQRDLESIARDRELMFNLSDIGIAYVIDGRIQRANAAMAQLAGCGTDELVGQPLQSLFAGGSDGRGDWPGESDSTQRGHWLGERPLRRQDGRTVWVRLSLRMVDENDAARGLIASCVNVDDRHRAEAAEALQAERTRAILDSVLVGIVTVGPRGIEWMNRSARRMFAGNLADFINLPMSTVATADPTHPFRRTHYREELVEGEAETFECRVKARDGREFWVAGNAVATGRRSTGRELTFALMDIERRRQADARIAEVQASLQRIIEAAPLAITLRDARTLSVLQINEVAARMLGRPSPEIVGRTPQELYEPELAESMVHDMQAALAASAVTVREYAVPVDGEMRTWDARYLPLAAPGQPPDQLLLVATDVTEQRVAQQAKFEAAIAQREMLVREVHHRIKNNLQGVAGLLQQVAVRKPEVASVISEVVGQVQAIAQVFGLQVGGSGPLRVTSVVEAITLSVQRTFGRAIELDVRGHLPREWALPEAESIPIALTINELLTNAVKHGRPRDTGEPEPVRCTMRLSDEGVTLEIASRSRLPEGFNLSRIPGGVSGLGLVRALLPRRSASLTLEQRGEQVVASVLLVPPGVTQIDPAPASAVPARASGGA